VPAMGEVGDKPQAVHLFEPLGAGVGHTGICRPGRGAPLPLRLDLL
jgi:hypothetical protein